MSINNGLKEFIFETTFEPIVGTKHQIGTFNHKYFQLKIDFSQNNFKFEFKSKFPAEECLEVIGSFSDSEIRQQHYIYDLISHITSSAEVYKRYTQMLEVYGINDQFLANLKKFYERRRFINYIMKK